MTTTESSAIAGPLDALLVDAALGPVRRFVPDLSTARWAASLARTPDVTARELATHLCCSILTATTRIPFPTSL